MLLSEKNLFKHFSEVLCSPLPFSQSTLQKDRLDGRLGLPFRRVGGGAFYKVEEVKDWLDGLPVVIPTHSHFTQTKKRGKPSKAETVEAARRGISVPQLRQGGSAC